MVTRPSSTGPGAPPRRGHPHHNPEENTMSADLPVIHPNGPLPAVMAPRTPTPPLSPPEYTHGLGEVIRAHRLFIGLSQRDMAARLNRDRRDYQRIESGRDACPPGLLGAVEDLADQFAHEVEMVLDEADRRDPEDGPLPLAVVTDGNAADEWLRLVAGRAAVEATDGHPISLHVTDSHKPAQVG
ncbi:HTH DNA binding protein [Mycobacterium phage Imvubu]|uniref:Helix-turn-helix DNA binding domain protein n=1 Tax=Mycobacterium phage Imvubu TaxID=2686233 RepID=A0A6B9LDN8_9CAUD|nr:HTH DNA binding protein [Mycobacterium phage Imvubu]QHB37778.1 helix-turn-helix DNA binding domain protein [Mycobacterium phage Imvubu]